MCIYSKLLLRQFTSLLAITCFFCLLQAIFENILVDLPLAEFFLAKILVDRASAHYLESLDPILYRNLLYLRDYEGDVQDLGLDFTYVTNDLGETKVGVQQKLPQ